MEVLLEKTVSIRTFLDGEFDGDFHKVINLKIGGELEFSKDVFGFVGFFTVTSGTIKNLSLIMDTELNISSVNKFSNVGLLVGQLSEVVGNNLLKEGHIQNCSTEGKIDVNISGFGFNLGGVVGSNYGEVEDCCNKVDLELTSSLSNDCRFGGICGVLEGVIENVGIMKNCYNVGDIYIDNNGSRSCSVGGLTGYLNNNNNNLSNYNLGNVNDTSNDSKVFLGGCYGKIGNGIINDNNFFYTLDNLVTAKDDSHKVEGGTILDADKLSSQNGVKLLNGTQEDKPWTYDKDINNGFPILKWQLTNNEND